MAHQLLFGGGRQLLIGIDAPVALHKGAGLHRLWLPMRLDTRNSMSAAVALATEGEVRLGQGAGDWLGLAKPAAPVTTYVEAFDTTLVLPLTDEQLAVIEQRRAGSDLSFDIRLWVSLGYDPAVADGDAEQRWPSHESQHEVRIQSEAWVRLLQQSSMGTSLAVVVPVPLGTDVQAAKIGEHLREAIRKINLGEYSDGVVAARKVLDLLEARKWPSAKSVVTIAQPHRTLDQRLGLMRDALASLAGPAPHGDEVADSIHWTRENALAVTCAISALAACMP